MVQPPYPVQFIVAYPDRQLDRVSTFFRLFAAIPIMIVLSSISGGTWQWASDQAKTSGSAAGDSCSLRP